MLRIIVGLPLVFASVAAAAAGPPERAAIPARTPGRLVDTATMQRIHAEVQTPFKYGVVLRGGPGELVDCPSVFRHDGRWYMVYVAIRDKAGYETWLARSDDLRHWEKLGRILPFRGTGWDAWQADGGAALVDYRWEGTHALERFGGKYWLSYLGGARPGYEPDLLAIGLAWTETPTAPAAWNRLPENPVLSPAQPDVRWFETVTLYKSTIIHDESASLGHPFVMFYNGKRPQGGHEAIGLAVSDDLIHWTRYGADPVIENGRDAKYSISGDPQIVRIGDVWVMFYFGAFWEPKAFDTFACSYDLVHWAKWDGPHLVQPGDSFDQTFAHKPWLLKYGGVVYHFYCAVGDQGRVIALATSRDLKTASAPP
jgi:predicted GH43/DUF377 family glycosyl hydrolase